MYTQSRCRFRIQNRSLGHRFTISTVIVHCLMGLPSSQTLMSFMLSNGFTLRPVVMPFRRQATACGLVASQAQAVGAGRDTYNVVIMRGPPAGDCHRLVFIDVSVGERLDDCSDTCTKPEFTAFVSETSPRTAHRTHFLPLSSPSFQGIHRIRLRHKPSHLYRRYAHTRYFLMAEITMVADWRPLGGRNYPLADCWDHCPIHPRELRSR